MTRVVGWAVDRRRRTARQDTKSFTEALAEEPRLHPLQLLPPVLNCDGTTPVAKDGAGGVVEKKRDEADDDQFKRAWPGDRGGPPTHFSNDAKDALYRCLLSKKTCHDKKRERRKSAKGGKGKLGFGIPPPEYDDDEGAKKKTRGPQ